MVSSVKSLIKRVLPPGALDYWYSLLRKRELSELDNARSPREIFSAIYRRNHWGKSDSKGDRFFSGTGSRNPEIVDRYVAAVSDFLRNHDPKLEAVDLGCGDFEVGSKIRRFCGGYTACDVVNELIAWNKSKYAELNVSFREVDITQDALPGGDVVFIRQVLQHLSNKDVSKVIPKLSQYRYVVLTEHLPATPNFEPNLDIKRGRDIRMNVGTSGSGLVLTKPPFNLRVQSERMLCEVAEASGDRAGVIRTMLYEL